MHKFTVNNTLLLSGWLFADLFLGLMVIFLASIPGVPPRLVPTPKVEVSPTSLSPKSHNCISTQNSYQCTVTLMETKDSLDAMDWESQSTVSNHIVFVPASGSLNPGIPVTITIKAIPCQNGSFTFTGSRNAKPVSVFWNCTLEPLKLQLKFQPIDWHIDNAPGLLSNDSNAIQQLKSDARSSLHGHIGLIIVYVGAPGEDQTEEAADISDKVASLLVGFGKHDIPALRDATTYNHLHILSQPESLIHIDVFYFNR